MIFGHWSYWIGIWPLLCATDQAFVAQDQHLFLPSANLVTQWAYHCCKAVVQDFPLCFYRKLCLNLRVSYFFVNFCELSTKNVFLFFFWLKWLMHKLHKPHSPRSSIKLKYKAYCHIKPTPLGQEWSQWPAPTRYWTVRHRSNWSTQGWILGQS